MNAEELRNLRGLIVAMSAYYGQKLSDQVIDMYAEDLADLPFDRVALALRESRRDPKTFRFPLPAVIRERICPAENKDHDAVEAVSRIFAAIRNVGPYQIDRAREYVGELGWEVVRSEGGWENVCQALTDDNAGILRAQWRQLALAKQSRAQSGVTEAPKLPRPASTGGLSSVGDMIKRLTSEVRHDF